ncbi:hypothetical protein EV06_0142 [Prochlorococcus sp. MIT 0602]|nr:hypothetical protein EV07_1418 [Prochlorococcus sp. MIT 0603]KGG18016.1 hypothetical protein EV06_0142 [Prochlorococcus sp. MIT 0602]
MIRSYQKLKGIIFKKLLLRINMKSNPKTEDMEVKYSTYPFDLGSLL